MQKTLITARKLILQDCYNTSNKDNNTNHTSNKKEHRKLDVHVHLRAYIHTYVFLYIHIYAHADCTDKARSTIGPCGAFRGLGRGSWQSLKMKATIMIVQGLGNGFRV